MVYSRQNIFQLVNNQNKCQIFQSSALRLPRTSGFQVLVQPIVCRFAKKVDTKLEEIRTILLKICRPISRVWKDLNKEVKMEQAEVELGLSFEGEGNLYVARSKMGANFKVKLIMKPEG